MSDAGHTEQELQAEFDRLSEAKGDQLAEFITGTDPANDPPETLEPPATPTAPEPVPAAPAAVAPAQPDKPAAAPAAAAADIWANAPAELREARNRELAAADHRYRSDLGRQAALQRKAQILEEEIKALRAKPAPAAATGASQPQPQPGQPAAATPAAAKLSLRDDPKIKRALEDYPDVVEPLLSVNEGLEARLEAIERDTSLTREERAAATVEAQEAALDAAHPDWRAAVASPEFKAWMGEQPKAIKAIIERNGEHVVDAEEAISMVGNFKAHYALTHPAQPQPAPQPQADTGAAAPHKPANLQARREAQLRAATGGRQGSNGPAAITDGPSNAAGDEAMFNHFAAKKVARTR